MLILRLSMLLVFSLSTVQQGKAGKKRITIDTLTLRPEKDIVDEYEH